MNASHEEKIIEILMAIQSDIRQIKVDVQSFINRQTKAAPMYLPQGDDVSEIGESGGPPSVEEVLRYLREKRGDDDWGTE